MECDEKEGGGRWRKPIMFGTSITSTYLPTAAGGDGGQGSSWMQSRRYLKNVWVATMVVAPLATEVFVRGTVCGGFRVFCHIIDIIKTTKTGGVRKSSVVAASTTAGIGALKVNVITTSRKSDRVSSAVSLGHSARNPSRGSSTGEGTAGNSFTTIRSPSSSHSATGKRDKSGSPSSSASPPTHGKKKRNGSACPLLLRSARSGTGSHGDKQRGARLAVALAFYFTLLPTSFLWLAVQWTVARLSIYAGGRHQCSHCLRRWC